MDNRSRKTMLWLLTGTAILIVLIKIRMGEFDFFGVLALLAIVVLGAALYMPSHWIHLISGIGMFVFFPLMGLITGRVPSLEKSKEGAPLTAVSEPGYWIMIVFWSLVSVGLIWFGLRVIKQHNASRQRTDAQTPRAPNKSLERGREE